MELLKYIIGPLIGAIGIGVSITLWLKGRSRKALSYELVSITSLFQQHDEIGKKFKIYFEDKEIKESVFMVLLKIVNNGNVPIEEKDFTTDIFIDIDKGTTLLAEIKETTPDNLPAKINTEVMGKTSILPLLLNSNEELTVKLLIKSNEGSQFNKDDIKIKSRIVGISEVTKTKKKIRKFELISMLLSSIGLSATFISLGDFKMNSNWFQYLTLGMFAAIIVSFSTEIYANKKK